MITLSKFPSDNVKKVHCPICGGRICDVKENEKVYLEKDMEIDGIIIKCNKCKNKINITVK